MEKIKNFVNSHINFNLYPIVIIPILAALAIFPFTKFLPREFGYENGLLENLQIFTLVISFIISLLAKSNKKFFCFAALVIILLTAREINYGRVIFFPIPGEINAYYSWKEIPYGYLVNPIIGLYMFGSLLYFIYSKAYCELWNIIKNIKFPLWNIAFLLLGMILGLFAEKTGQSFIMEEACELLFYLSLMSIIWLYAFNKNFIVNKK